MPLEKPIIIIMWQCNVAISRSINHPPNYYANPKETVKFAYSMCPIIILALEQVNWFFFSNLLFMASLLFIVFGCFGSSRTNWKAIKMYSHLCRETLANVQTTIIIFIMRVPPFYGSPLLFCRSAE